MILGVIEEEEAGQTSTFTMPTSLATSPPHRPASWFPILRLLARKTRRLTKDLNKNTAGASGRKVISKVSLVVKV